MKHIIPLYVFSALTAPSLHAIMAGGEFDSPEDRPSFRVDPLTTTSPYNFVGGLSIDTGASTYYGTGVALSSNWVLTAGHNVDFNDDGTADSDLSIEINIPGFGSYSVDSYQTHPNFTGFGNPTVQNDLSLLYFSSPLPDLAFPALGFNMGVGDTLTLTGFGRSGYGSYGYTTSAGVTDRRLGQNVVDSFEQGDAGSGLLFRYDFDAPDTFGTVGGSLGNDVETIIGPGDSGGSALVEYGDGFALVGVNSFTEGFGGRFGDIGGGVALNDQWGWIRETTGLALVPEPSLLALLVGWAALLLTVTSRRTRPDSCSSATTAST